MGFFTIFSSLNSPDSALDFAQTSPALPLDGVVAVKLERASKDSPLLTFFSFGKVPLRAVPPFSNTSGIASFVRAFLFALHLPRRLIDAPGQQGRRRRPIESLIL